MAAAAPDHDRPVADVNELVDAFHAAAKPRAAWRVGAEHEKIGVTSTGAPVPYNSGRGIAAVLGALAKRCGWAEVHEGEHVIALTRDGASVTLEPGGQLELSGAPHFSTATITEELRAHLHEVKAASAPLGLSWLKVGFRPLGTLDDVPWMPKGRYAVMREYLPTRGTRGLEMMKRTATVQANLDYSDEDDAGRKFNAAMSVTSLVTALYANSPLVDGKDSGWQSWRARVWLDTDNDRCGIPALSFQPTGLFARYTEWALDVPMFFVRRGGAYRPAGGMSFRRFLRDGWEGERATLADWQLHLSTLFPETRLKGYIEVRGADSGPMPMVTALPALWKGLLYDDAACAAASRLTAHLSYPQRLALREAVPQAGLAATLPSAGGGEVKVGELVRELVAIAHDGLSRVEPSADALLAPLDEVVTTGRAPAERVRDAARAAAGDPSKLVAALAY